MEYEQPADFMYDVKSVGKKAEQVVLYRSFQL